MKTAASGYFGQTGASYEEMAKQYQGLDGEWKSNLRCMLIDHGLSYIKIARGCGVPERFAKSLVHKIPPKREYVIMLAMMMGLSVDQTNELLVGMAEFQKLYSRNPSDAIWIYLLEKGGSQNPRALFREYYAVYRNLKREYRRQEASKPMDTVIALQRIVEQAHNTELRRGAEQVEFIVDTNFEEMIWTILPSFENGYQKLLDYLDSFFYDVHSDNGFGQMVQENLAWKEAYYRKICALRQNQIIPDRAFLIVLGKRMGMNPVQLNRMLELAGMGPLCPRDRLDESVVVYLEEKNCHFPGYPHSQNAAPPSGRRPGRSDTVYMDLYPNSRGFEDNPIEQVNEYIERYTLGNDMFEFGYSDYIMELSQCADSVEF